MMKFKILFFVLVLILSMTGCQLARTDLEPSGDRLMGVLVTSEYLDLFDMEGYINDNLNSFKNDMIIDGDRSEYEGRIYVTMESVTRTYDDGTTYQDTTPVFSGLEGIYYIASRVQTDHEFYNRVYCSDGIIHAQNGYNYGDNSEAITLEGEIWMAQSHGNMEAYINPVYQDSSGNFYVVSGQGFSTSGDNAVGGIYKQTLEETHTVTEDNETKTVSVSISISLGTMYEPEQYVLLQMDPQNNIIQKDTYLPGELPKDLIPDPNTEYLILETHNHDAEKDARIERTIYARDTDQIPTYFANEDGFMMEHHSFIQWEK